MEFFSPKNIDEFFKVRERYPDAVLLAGGTDLMAQWHNNRSTPERVISISNLKELSFIKEDRGIIEIGALTTHTEISENKLIKKGVPVLAYAASLIGAPAIRNMGTIGGNIANASPAADLPPVLLIYDSSLVLRSKTQLRELKLYEFYKGYKNTVIKSDEIIYSIKVPIPDAVDKVEFYKVGTRQAQSIAKVSLAGFLKKEKKEVEVVRLAAGSVAPVPIRLFEVEKYITGKPLTRSVVADACDTLLRYLKPISDVRSTEEYRKIAMKGLLLKFLQK
jgi:CO/xanthine dehydrogenase FAD-binding subunit